MCGCDPYIRQRPCRLPKGDTLEKGRVGGLITFEVYWKCGVRLCDALDDVYSGLSGRDEPTFVGSRTSTSTRL